MAAVATCAAGLAGARPAAADPPAPTNYRSVIEAVEPATEAVDVDVVGGDAFLKLSVDDDHTALVAGYLGEPYLRVLSDGTVERNRRSPATYLNESRDGAATLPPDADAEAPPEWERVAGGGTYAWHDHRIHWMQSEPPQGIEPGDVVQTWSVPLTVDDVPGEVRGQLVRLSSVSPVPWILLGVASAIAVVGATRAARGQSAERLPSSAIAVAALIAVPVAAAQYAAAPSGSGMSPVPLAMTIVGLVGGLAGLILTERGHRFGPIASLAGGSAAIGWAALRLDVLTAAVLPTELPFDLDRGVTALVLGMGIAGAALLAWQGGTARAAVDGPSERSA